ncbi:Smr/MutS family protein [candidate division KSB1 bacterium]|nr:Smr/MutS family protein [candidate division KSB1 bacterium]
MKENGQEEYYKVTDVLDLHGFFPEQAEEMVYDFVQNGLDLGLSRLRIIHGKGKSKLKWVVYQVLKEHPQVTDFYDAPPELGGWGSTIVEISRALNSPPDTSPDRTKNV